MKGGREGREREESGREEGNWRQEGEGREEEKRKMRILRYCLKKSCHQCQFGCFSLCSILQNVVVLFTSGKKVQ